MVMRYRRFRLARGTALACVLACGAGGAAAAQATADAGPPAPKEAEPATSVSEVVVTNYGYTIQRSIQAKQRLDVISDVVSSDQVGAIPDFGLGEALQRVPGVNFIINNGRGEAQFATIRGLNPDYNTVLVDGIALPSTEETRRSVSFDVLPSIIVNQVSVYKTGTSALPGDSTGGVIDLRTHSAFDHRGWFFAGHLDASYWENERELHENVPSGQGDVRISKTFGPDDRFGALVLVSYFSRASNSLNSYSLPYSYYPYNRTTGGVQTVNAVTLTPTTDVTGLTPIPDRRRWYFYDNIRQRPGALAKLEYDDHRFHGHITGGIFQHNNDEYRYSQYINRGPATATFTSPTQASFTTGTYETDFDKYNQYRQISYGEVGGGWDIDPVTKLEATFNYGFGRYRQDTTEDVFTTPTSAAFGFTDIGQVGKAQFFQPLSLAAFQNPASYNQTYHLSATDKSKTLIPQLRVDYVHNQDPGASGWGWRFGYQWREVSQTFTYYERRLNRAPTATQTLATVGALGATITPFDSNGVPLLFVDDKLASAFTVNNPNLFVLNNSVVRNNLNNFTLQETTHSGYGQVSWRQGRLYANLGLRLEATDQQIDNVVPSPLNSTTTFAVQRTSSDYLKPLPSLNVSYDVLDDLKLRGAITRTLGRARYSDLAQNNALTINGAQASQTIANPNLRPREATNYDLSLEYYWRPGAILSLAVFRKEIDNEIFSLTTTQQNVALPGLTGAYTLTTTTPTNAGTATVNGAEVNASISRFDFLPAWTHGVLKDFGVAANATFLDFDAPRIQMSDRVTFRRLPQLLESARYIANAQVFYNHGPFAGEVAYNHTAKMPTSFDLTNAVNDQWFRATDTVDAQVSWKFARGLALRVQAKNLFNTRNQRVVGPNQSLNYSLLDNGRAYYAGVSFVY